MMLKKLFLPSLLGIAVLASSNVYAENNNSPFTVASEDVTPYTRPDHMYTPLESYSDNIQYDLPYCGDNSSDSQILHLVFPSDANTQEEKIPLLVFIHGGGWSALNSSDHKVSYTGESALWALERGYAVAFVDYTLANETTPAMPNQVYEVKAAIRYLRSVADEYNLDSDKIAVMGESAGGHLVDMIASTIGEKEYDLEDYGNMDYSSDVQAVITQYSVADLSAMPESVGMLYGINTSDLSETELQTFIQESSPLEHVDGNEPPFFIEAGLEDTTVPYTQSCSLYDAVMMKNEDSESELHLFPGMDHAVTWFQSEENADLYLNWLDKIFER